MLLLPLLFLFSACQARQAPPAEDQEQKTAWMEMVKKAEDIPVSAKEGDIVLVNEILSRFSVKGEERGKPGKLIIALGGQFTGTPYVGHTLEANDTERLVVNIREMDCTTFVETILALALTIEQGKTSFEDFAGNLAFLRYREAYPNGYASRLHYFSEWMHLHTQQGLLELLSDQIGSQAFDNRVSFMSTNPEAYKQLSDPVLVQLIKEAEKAVSVQKMNYIPKEEIRELEKYIQNGDIIAFTTDIEGLDVSHTGFAYFREDRLHLLHASTRSNSVEISPVPLSDYLSGMGRVTGILVARVK